MSEILDQLAVVLKERKNASPESSYVSALYHKGVDAILKKIGEESTEVVIAAKSNDKEQIVYELADLWFHSMVLLEQQNLSYEQVLNELARRFGVSGIDEKAARNK